MNRWRVGAAFVSMTVGCRHPARDTTAVDEVRVAAASSLAPAMDDLAPIAAQAGLHIVATFGATGMLARQIEQGAPYDVFIAADRETPARLEHERELVAGSTHVFARGRLVIASAAGVRPPASTLRDLIDPRFRQIAIANPDTAPFGRAAREALVHAQLWDALAPRIVYAESVQQAYQFMASGNTDAALTSASVVRTGDAVADVDPALFTAIDETLSTVRASPRRQAVQRFVELLHSSPASAVLVHHGLAPVSAP